MEVNLETNNFTVLSPIYYRFIIDLLAIYLERWRDTAAPCLVLGALWVERFGQGSWHELGLGLASSLEEL